MWIQCLVICFAWYSCLLQQCAVGMDGPLVDEEQFPRDDIDLYSVRHARHRIICKSFHLFTLCGHLLLRLKVQNFIIE